MSIEPQSWRRILWIRLDHIGDVAMSLPMLAALREALPQAEIDCLVRPAVAPLLQASGLKVRVLTFDTPRFPEKQAKICVGPLGRGGGLFRGVALLRRIKKRRYDAAFELRGDEVGRAIAWAAGIPVRIGPDRQFYEEPGARNGARLLTLKVPLPVEPRHAVLNNLALLQRVGISANGGGFRFPVTEEMRRRVEAKLEALEVEGAPILLHPCSNDPRRNWSDKSWAELTGKCRSVSQAPMVWTGSARDHAKVAEIMKHHHPGGIFDATGRFTLQELPALFDRSRLLITVDTGPMHIAALQGLPIVAMMREDLVARHHPWGQPGAAVSAAPNEPVETIPLDEVWEKVRPKLA